MRATAPTDRPSWNPNVNFAATATPVKAGKAPSWPRGQTTQGLGHRPLLRHELRAKAQVPDVRSVALSAGLQAIQAEFDSYLPSDEAACPWSSSGSSCGR